MQVPFNKQLIMVGFGVIGQAVLPLLFKHLAIQPRQIRIITKDDEGLSISQTFGVQLHPTPITKSNYGEVLSHLQPGDLLLNVSVDVSSLDLIEFCRTQGALYLDLCTEPWRGFYNNPSLTPALRTNYALRKSILPLKNKSGPTAIITHGANPGLVSHFVKQALMNIAQDNGFTNTAPSDSYGWASLAQQLAIKVIHVAERDTQICHRAKQLNEFINTWSVEGFMAEGVQPAELSWGTHEQHWPEDACRLDKNHASIYLNRPGNSVRVRTWTPSWGPFHGFLISHAESISIANYLTLKKDNTIQYCPTAHYAYLPCPDAVLSLDEFAGREWHSQVDKRLIVDDIVSGHDELGVLLMGNKLGAYWYGSQLSTQEARQLVPYNNATSLQVAAGVISGILWAIEHPNKGVVEPEDMDYQYHLRIAKPYLGTLKGYYTDWTPLQHREYLFEEKLDTNDPWQFLNIRVK